MKLIVVIFSVLVTLSNASADPVTGAGQMTILSNIYAELKLQYGEMLKQLQEAKKASESLNDVKNISKDMVKEYKFIQGFSLEAEISNIKSDMQGLTMLDDINGNMTTLQKIEIMNAEMDRRIKDNPNISEKDSDKLKEKYADMIRLKELEDKKRIEAGKASGGQMTDKNLASSNASSNAMIAAALLAEERRRVYNESLRVEDEAAVNKSFSNYWDSK